MTPSNTDPIIPARSLSVTSVSSVAPLPLPATSVAVRVATIADLPFIDALQKKQSRAVGWMPTKTLEGKIALGQILVASAPRRWSKSEDMSEALMTREERVGYLIACDRYFKHDDVGIIYAINVVPDYQRSLVAATLLKAQFERSAYGCRLYCCWCAQDLAANRFWEAMGFVPLAFRAGSRTKGKNGTARVHLFWQKRIRAGDTGDPSRGGTPWWYPSQTSGGSIREDRLVLPIPPGVHWSDAKPIVLPTAGVPGSEVSEPRRVGFSPRASAEAKARGAAANAEERGLKPTLRTSSRRPGGIFFAPATPIEPVAIVKEKAKREPRKKAKHDPALVAKARELRDRWLEQVNASDAALLPMAKYEVSRAATSRIDGPATRCVERSPARPLLGASDALLAHRPAA